MLNQVALVSQTSKVSLSDLSVASAAIQKQITRDVAPIWNLDASVDAFESLDAVPLGYWSVAIMDQIPFEAEGIHLNQKNGQPFALVTYSDDWTLTVSHETIEMLVDPSGNRTVACNSPKPGQGRVLALVETCDPSEAAQFGYSVNGVLVSDFYTPRFFDPVASSGVQYSFTGAITQPRQVLDGGYISWWDPDSKHMFQMTVTGKKPTFHDLGELPQGFGTLRSFADLHTNKMRHNLKKTTRKGMMLTSALAGKSAKPSAIDRSRSSHAKTLKSEMDSVIRSLSKSKK